MDSRIKDTIVRHDKGFNCAQAVACTYCDLLGYKEEDMIYRLLVLEDYFPEMKLERNSKTGDVVINFHNKKLNDFLFAWGVIRGKRARGLITDDEYLNW